MTNITVNKIILTITSIIGLPSSVIGFLLHWPTVLMFIFYCLNIITLAGYMGRATESLAIVMGRGIGGLLNATFGIRLNSLSRFSL